MGAPTVFVVLGFSGSSEAVSLVAAHVLTEFVKGNTKMGS